MLRIAFFGPMPPANTGIADYDEALLPLLREHYEMDVYTRDSHIHFYTRHQQRPYDLNLYQMGNNSLFHKYMWAYAFPFPGATVFHDCCLHHSRAAMLMDRALYKEYREELMAVYPEQAEKIGNAVISFAGANLLFFYFPFFQLLLSSSLAAAAHTDAAVQELRISETPVIKIPHPELPARVRLDRDPFPGRFVIGSFGYATRAKRISSILKAVAHLRNYYPQILYLIAGEIENPRILQSEMEQLGLKDVVHITGYIDNAEFLQWMSRADVIVNLRYPSAGEMSGTLVRALACGKPVLISKIPQLREIPEQAALRIRTTHEQEDIVLAIAKLIEQEPLRTRLGAAARQYVEECHRPAQTVEKYRELIETALQRKTSFRSPKLPDHLKSGKQTLRDYIRKTALDGVDSTLLDWIL